MTVNERVREVRKAQGLSLEAFGKRLNVTKPSIYKVETGENNLSERMLQDICREFSVNEVWLRTGQGEMFVAKYFEAEVAEFAKQIINYGSDSFQARFIHALSKLDESEWDVLIKIAEEMQAKKEKEES